MHCAAINNHTEIIDYIINDLQMKELDKEDQVSTWNVTFWAPYLCRTTKVQAVYLFLNFCISVRTSTICPGGRAWLCWDDGYADRAVQHGHHEAQQGVCGLVYVFVVCVLTCVWWVHICVLTPANSSNTLWCQLFPSLPSARAGTRPCT